MGSVEAAVTGPTGRIRPFIIPDPLQLKFTKIPLFFKDVSQVQLRPRQKKTQGFQSLRDVTGINQKFPNKISNKYTELETYIGGASLPILSLKLRFKIKF